MRTDRLEPRALHILFVQRLLMGGIFLAVWFDNLASGKYGAKGYAHFLRHYAGTTPFHSYAHFLTSAVIPNARILAPLQMVVELVVFAGFWLAGFLTPVAAVLGSLFFVGVLLDSWAIDWQGTYVLLIAMLLSVGIGQAGRIWSVDALLARRNPKLRLPLY